MPRQLNVRSDIAYDTANRLARQLGATTTEVTRFLDLHPPDVLIPAVPDDDQHAGPRRTHSPLDQLEAGAEVRSSHDG